MDYRYNKTARDFDADLSEFLTELEGERVIKEAVSKDPDDSLQQFVTAPSALDEIRGLTNKQSAAEVLEEHGVRQELRKMAAKSRDEVDAFLAAEDG